MPELVVTVRFLDARFHGRGDGGRPEWPPSPMRLFQALLAAAKPRWNDSLREAFHWLERNRPPVVHAPKGVCGQLRVTYVLNNNSDATNAALRTEKRIRPILLSEAHAEIHYRWHVKEADRHYAEQIARIASRLRALGWGIDMAIGRGRVVDHAAGVDEALTELRPSQAQVGGVSLRVPIAGSLESLELAYADALARVSPDGTLRDAPGRTRFDTMTYCTTLVRPFVAFGLAPKGPDDAPPRVASRQIKQLVGMMRAACSTDHVREALGDDVVNEVILGHGTEKGTPRLSILPLPSIGHAHADGLIRRVMLAEPFGAEGRICEALGQLLHACPLVPADPGDDLAASLTRIDGFDPVVRHYTTVSHDWASVTPVLLPGYDDRKEHRGNHTKRLERAEQLVCKSLAHAGIACRADIQLTRVPFVPGTHHAGQYVPRGKLQHYPRYHVRLSFDKVFAGPLSLGAGRHCGFGVFAAVD